jgi:hypothetical protein
MARTKKTLEERWTAIREADSVKAKERELQLRREWDKRRKKANKEAAEAELQTASDRSRDARRLFERQSANVGISFIHPMGEATIAARVKEHWQKEVEKKRRGNLLRRRRWYIPKHKQTAVNAEKESNT